MHLIIRTPLRLIVANFTPVVSVVDVYQKWAGPCTVLNPFLKAVRAEISTKNLLMIAAQADDIEPLKFYLLRKIAELLLFANCWRANKNWSALIVAGVFSLRNCGWVVERFFFICFLEVVLREQYVTSAWTPPTMSSPASGPLSGRLALKGACFRMRMTLGVVIIRSLVCAICVQGRLRSGSGVALI